MSDPFNPLSWATHRTKALEHADDWRKRAMFQTALANGAGLLAVGTFVQNGPNHDFTARAFVLSAAVFALGLLTGGIAPFLMIRWWEHRADASRLNQTLTTAKRARLDRMHLTADSSEVDRLMNEGIQRHGKMRQTRALASLCIALSGLLFFLGLGLVLVAVEDGALRSPPPTVSVSLRSGK